MDVVMLSRLQFAAATMFHYLFVPLTLGLSVLVACMETQYVRTGDETYLSMTRFWGKIFLINFALGVVTGITLEFQFGTNWSGYSAYVGDIFGSLLAIEATAAFFLESTFIGVWIFGWDKLSKKAHAACMWLVAGASNLSAVWILIANGWMQHPVGFDLRGGRAEMVSFSDVVFNPFGWLQFFHVLPAAFVLAAFLIMGISAWHLLKKQHVDFFTRSFKIGLVTGLAASLVVAAEGDFHAAHVAKVQPAKLAAMETHWDTKTNAPVYLFSVPDEENEKNLIEIGELPGLLSFLAFKDVNAEVRGLKEFPRDERPPVLLTSLAFKGMVGLGTFFILITVAGWFLRNRLVESPVYLRIMLFAIPLPYIANQLGWLLTEVGRQPWIVQGLMKTTDGVSPVDPTQVMISLIAFILVYGTLGAAGFYLVANHAKKGPEAVGTEV
ncbi:cytochrome ubiquinol oxidase subunit I [Desulfonema ishimotonii]|uniref:Cytochrome ubiquinol oxidase subunit I n=1 Tax=Desulfonema ishimotonii TaxID=45657 RepID=A0A401G0F3_9BACT|nr:cytochrome ubiquinol oxidase subunit I [Desulfonema ishimotonii]GBC62700.1 cytochrome ubiquinol oxidase subunit I [Desulfonema ishimotonii]